MENISARNMWGNYLDAHPKTTFREAPKVIQFYDNEEDADKHADMVVNGTKRAASFPLLGLQCRKESLPQIGSFLIIIDGRGHARCIARITSMALRPFFGIKDDFVRQEGFSDMQQWKTFHWDYFRRELAPYHRTPKDSTILVCVTFEKVYD